MLRTVEDLLVEISRTPDRLSSVLLRMDSLRKQDRITTNLWW